MTVPLATIDRNGSRRLARWGPNNRLVRVKSAAAHMVQGLAPWPAEEAAQLTRIRTVVRSLYDSLAYTAYAGKGGRVFAWPSYTEPVQNASPFGDDHSLPLVTNVNDIDVFQEGGGNGPLLLKVAVNGGAWSGGLNIWTQILASGSNVTGIWAASSSYSISCDELGRIIYHNDYNDDPQTFTAYGSGPALRAIAGSSPVTGALAVGDNGKIAALVGTPLARIDLTPPAGYESVNWSDVRWVGPPAGFVMCGAGGKLLGYTGGAAGTWIPIPTGVGQDLRAISPIPKPSGPWLGEFVVVGGATFCRRYRHDGGQYVTDGYALPFGFVPRGVAGFGLWGGPPNGPQHIVALGDGGVLTYRGNGWEAGDLISGYGEGPAAYAVTLQNTSGYDGAASLQHRVPTIRYAGTLNGRAVTIRRTWDWSLGDPPIQSDTQWWLTVTEGTQIKWLGYATSNVAESLFFNGINGSSGFATAVPG